MAEQQGEDIMGSQNDENTPLMPGSNSVPTDGPAASSDSKTAGQDKALGKRSKLFVTVCILLTELCERLTFYGLTGNLLLFCSEFLKFKSPWPSTITYLFQGTCYFVPIFAGWLADAYLGRFNVIYGSGLLYVLGTVLLVLVSTTKEMFGKLFGKESDLSEIERRLYFCLALVLIALGTGGIKSNVSPFGADQVQHYGPRAVQRFFNWFYWFINVGSLGAFTIVVYAQQRYAFVDGYIITACTMLLAVILFFVARNKYWNRPPGGSLLADTAKVIGQALKNRKKVAARNASSWLDRAKDTFGGSYTDMQVEDVKGLLRVIPVFLTIIVYWMIYSQMATTFLLQATYMKLKVHKFTVPAASLSIFDIIGVLALIPFMDHVVYPLLRYCGVRFTPLKRIAVGMLFAVSSMCVAGAVEIARKNDIQDGHFINQTVFNKTLKASNLNVFYQVPQFALIGASEVLTSITGLEFAYSQAPKTLQGLVMGAFLVTSGLGSYAASLLVIIVRSASHGRWYPGDDLNNGSLECFFFLLAGLMLVNFLAFLLVARSYKYKASTSERQDIRDGGTIVPPTDGDV